VRQNAVHVFNLLQAAVGHATALSDVGPEDWAQVCPSDMCRRKTSSATSCKSSRFAGSPTPLRGSYSLACGKRREAGKICSRREMRMPEDVIARVSPPFAHRSFVLLLIFDILWHCLIILCPLLDFTPPLLYI
jgi:hypothetical protein